MAKIVEFGNSKNPFEFVDDKTISRKEFKNLSKVVKMFNIRRAGYQNVVQVDKSKMKLTKNAIHKSLKRLSSIF